MTQIAMTDDALVRLLDSCALPGVNALNRRPSNGTTVRFKDFLPSRRPY